MGCVVCKEQMNKRSYEKNFTRLLSTSEEKTNHAWEKRQDGQLTRRLKIEHENDKKILKLLLLGAGESGKSTLFKQLKTIYNDGFKSEAERADYESVVYSNVYSAMTLLIRQSHALGLFIAPHNMVARDAVLRVNHCTDMFKPKEMVLTLDTQMAQYINALWHDAAIIGAYSQKSKFNLFDSCSYFMGRIQVIGQPGYIPSQEDVYRTRSRTTGIACTMFDIQRAATSHIFEMYDVGGQRNERKKWIHCFQEITAIIFVASLSGYSQTIFEYDDENDEEVEINRMDESLNLFEDIVNSSWFVDTAIILFLNKKDLFEELLPREQLSEYFPDYDGDNSYDDAAEWIKQLYLGCIDDEDVPASNKNIVYTHITCATNTRNIEVVFDVVKDVIITENLAKSGLSAE